MKTLSELRALDYEIMNARNRYWTAIRETLKEVGKELRVVSEDYDEDLGYPEGLLLSVPNKHGIMVDCVYDRIKMDGERIKVHIAYWDDSTEDYWQSADEIGYNDLLDIYSAIDWDGNVKEGESEDRKLMVLCSYDEDYAEHNNHLIIDESYLKTERGKERFTKWMHDHFDDACQDEDDDKELEDCINGLLTDFEGYFGIRYYFEDYTAIL